MKKIIIAALLAASGLLFFNACKYDSAEEQPGNYPVVLEVQLKNGGGDFALNTSYINAFGESYTVNKLLFYISNIELLRHGAGINAKEQNSYHLIDAASAASQKITFTSPFSNVTGIRFLVGVDSLRNVSGAQTDALDPLNGMFWTWSSGYIMAKMEGVSPQSTQVGNLLIHHIGGFSGTKNATRWVTLEFPAGKKMMTAGGDTCTIEIQADAGKWFNGKHDVKIADFAFTMSPGGTAMKIADNYATMFRVADVKNN